MVKLVQIRLANGKQILTEIAGSPEEQRVGMLKHDSIVGKPAMLFPYANPTDVTFHTMGMKFPIDIVMLQRVDERKAQTEKKKVVWDPIFGYHGEPPPIPPGHGLSYQSPGKKEEPPPKVPTWWEDSSPQPEPFVPVAPGSIEGMRRAMMDLSSFSAEELQEALAAMEKLEEQHGDGLTYQEILDEIHRRVETGMQAPG